MVSELEVGAGMTGSFALDDAPLSAMLTFLAEVEGVTGADITGPEGREVGNTGSDPPRAPASKRKIGSAEAEGERLVVPAFAAAICKAASCCMERPCWLGLWFAYRFTPRRVGDRGDCVRGATGKRRCESLGGEDTDEIESERIFSRAAAIKVSGSAGLGLTW
jgi:hypothetical protein